MHQHRSNKSTKHSCFHNTSCVKGSTSNDRSCGNQSINNTTSCGSTASRGTSCGNNVNRGPFCGNTASRGTSCRNTSNSRSFCGNTGNKKRSCGCHSNRSPGCDKTSDCDNTLRLRDYGPAPCVINLEKATEQNTNYRTALWTGCHLQMTLMCIEPGESIGLENHPCVDQCICIVEGKCTVKMGNCRDNLNLQQQACEGYCAFIPANTWHNVCNTGCKPLKLFTLYAPPEHPHGTVQSTKPTGCHY